MEIFKPDEPFDKAQAIDDLKLFHGLPPYDHAGNELRMQAALATAIVKKYKMPMINLRNATGFNVLLEQVKTTLSMTTEPEIITLEKLREQMEHAIDMIGFCAGGTVNNQHLFKCDADIAVMSRAQMDARAMLDLMEAAVDTVTAMRKVQAANVSQQEKERLQALPHA